MARRVFYHTSELVFLMSRLTLTRNGRRARLVPEGKGPFPHDNYELGELTMEKIMRIAAEESIKRFDIWTSRFGNERMEDTKEKNNSNQRLAGLQHQAQQPRFAMEADVKSDTKTRKRTEGAAAD